MPHCFPVPIARGQLLRPEYRDWWSLLLTAILHVMNGGEVTTCMPENTRHGRRNCRYNSFRRREDSSRIISFEGMVPARLNSPLRLRHRPLRHHLHQIGPVFRRGVDVAHQILGRHLDRPPAPTRRTSSPAPPRCPWRGRRRRRPRPSPRRARRPCPWRRTRRRSRSARPGCGISRSRPCSGAVKLTAVTISPSFSAVSNRPVKNLSAAISRLLVTMVAPSASSAAG